MTPKPLRKVIVIDEDTKEELRRGPMRGEETEFRLIRSLFGLSRDTIVKLAFGMILGAIWYANDINFKNTVLQYMAKQDIENAHNAVFRENSDIFHTSVWKVQFKDGRPLNDGYEPREKEKL